MLALLVLAAIWGTSFLLIKVGLQGLSPPQLVLGRVGTGALALLAVGAAAHIRPAAQAGGAVQGGRAAVAAPALAHRGGPGLSIRRLPWGALVVVAIISNVIPFLLFAWGETRVPSGLAGLLNATTPLFTVGVALAALPEERLSRTRAVGLALGLAGVVVVLSPWRALGHSLVGELACLGAAASYGLAFVFTRRVLTPRRLPTLTLATGQLVAAFAVLAVLAPLIATGPMTLTPGVVASVVVLGAVNTGFAYLLYHYLVREAGATRASTVTYLVPVVAVALGVAVRGEPLSWALVVGGLIVILGVVTLEGRVRWAIPAGVRRRPRRDQARSRR
ncbi:MAG: DMT family transporter [Acidimicrobiales bacterium]